MGQIPQVIKSHHTIKVFGDRCVEKVMYSAQKYVNKFNVNSS
jgi:hypothetical protein